MTTNPILHPLNSFYRANRPELINPRITLDWVNNTGWESEIYAFTLTHGPVENRQETSRVLRLLSTGAMADTRKEFNLLTLLNRAGYPVPQVFALGEPDDGLGRPFIIMQRIEGGDFAARFPQSPADDLAPLQQFVTLFRRLHTLDWRPHAENPDDFDPLGGPYRHFDRRLAEYERYLLMAGEESLNLVLDWLKAHRGMVSCARSSVVHGDFHQNNILADAAGNLYVIDWTAGGVSDYRFDLAWTLTLALAYHGPGFQRLILDEYQHQSGGPVPALEIFEVIAILRRIGSVMISLGAGAEALGMRPEAVDAMRHEREPLGRLYQRLVSLTGLPLPDVADFLEMLF